MKCPYIANQTVITQCNITYDEDSERQKMWKECQVNKVSLADCLKEECGAYKNGECHYNNN